MTLLGGWVLAPLVLALLCGGLGLFVERAARVVLPGGLVPAVGLAALIVLAGTATAWEATTGLAVPVVGGVAAAGIIWGRPWQDERLGRTACVGAGLALAAFAVYAAPSLLSGQGSVAGYVKLDDSATWMATVERAMEHARDVSVAPGSYSRTLATWLGAGYPIGAFLPLAASASLSGQDLANAYQPTIATLAAILALGLWTCARSLVRSPLRAAGAAFVAVQASLLLGYAQWGGIKEVCVAALLPAVGWCCVRGGRTLPVLALVVGALVVSLNLNGLGWGGPPLVIAAIVQLRGARSSKATLTAAGALLAVAAVPALKTLDFVRQTTIAAGGIRNEDDLGNLVEPLRLIQGAGLWPTGDFRYDPPLLSVALALAIAVALAFVVGVAVAARRRTPELPVLAVVTLAGGTAAVAVGSAWIDAKALAMISPVVLLGAATLAAVGLEAPREGLRAVSASASVVLAAGILWSTLAVLRDVYVAPRERLAELRDIGTDIAGQGPTLQLDAETYGDRYFLRDAEPEGATDLRVREVLDVDGRRFPGLSTAEVDRVAVPSLWVYRTLVRRRSPVASRPPGRFVLKRGGRFWEVWQRASDAPAPLARLALGNENAPAAVPSCSDVRRLASTTGVRSLTAVARRAPVVVALGAGEMPAAWRASSGRPAGDGLATFAIDVPATGRWRAWVGGGVLGGLDVRIDGRVLGSVRHELNYSGQWLRFGTAHLRRGRHRLVLRYRRGALWRSGRGAPEAQLPLGPIALTPADADEALGVIEVDPQRYRRLCDGRTYDWIEARP